MRKKRNARPETARQALEAHRQQQHAHLPAWCSDWGTHRGQGYVARLVRIQYVAEGKV